MISSCFYYLEPTKTTNVILKIIEWKMIIYNLSIILKTLFTSIFNECFSRVLSPPVLADEIYEYSQGNSFRQEF